MDEQAKWNILFSGLYAVALYFAVTSLRDMGHLTIAVPTTDLVLLSLAIFRATRLFVYDHIMEWFRNLFMDLQRYDDGSSVLLRPERGMRRTIATLLNCPWCLAMWAALPITYLYFLTPLFWFPILILALSGAATFIQITASLVGWNAELAKQKVHAHWGEK